MVTPTAVKIQIEKIIFYTISTGLSDDYNFPYMDTRSSAFTKIDFPGVEHVRFGLGGLAYDETYLEMVDARAYNVKMLDGALVQMTYEFQNRTLKKHRLAFVPSPFLAEFQNDPDIYMNDEIYADIINRSIVPVPIRFDYDDDEDVHRVVDHPKSHLTLGQYESCRIPVSAPLTPFQFADFVVRNFYHTIYARSDEQLPSNNARFPLSIVASEREVAHVVVSP